MTRHLKWAIPLLVSLNLVDIVLTFSFTRLGMVEANPLFHWLTLPGFIAFKFALVGIACILLWYIAKLPIPKVIFWFACTLFILPICVAVIYTITAMSVPL